MHSTKINRKTKTKGQLQSELAQMRQRILQLETAESDCRQAMEEIHRSYQVQAVINRLLHISLDNISLELMLEQFIDEVTSLDWLALESKGAIFIVGADPEVLLLKAHRALSPKLLRMCNEVPFGKCLCGQAASTGTIQFADCIDQRHDREYQGIAPHGHYCVPIVSRGQKVLGVITLYLKEGHCRDQREEDFLTAVSNTLAGIIELKHTQAKLEEKGIELELKRNDLEEVNTALRVLLKKRDEDKLELEENLLLNIKTLVRPCLEKLKNCTLNKRQASYLDVLESNLLEVISPFARKMSSKYLNLTASEIQVANLILEGKRTKEIASFLNLSDKTIEVHRKNIRKKLGLRSKKENLRTHLLALQ